MTAEPFIRITPIGYVTTSYDDLALTPPQPSESAQAIGQVVLNANFVDALLGLEQYPFLWLITWVHRDATEPGPLQVVPRAKQATGEIQGVFASRSPRRPNSIGLSLVRQLGIDDNIITFAGVDMVDGTPVLDIKPWFADCDLPPDGDGLPGSLPA
jgi:tRNA-Thr(GGU) m(6)t(6)A37 methyltransferase TsaA